MYFSATNHPRDDGIIKSPMQSEKKKANPLPVYSFTLFDIVVVFVSIGTYLADIITDILVTLVYWRLDEKIWAALTLLFLLVPSIIMQIFSARWYLADGHRASFTMFLTHLFMMGPIKRYIEVLNYGIRARRTKRIEDYQAMYSELSDVSMLRLFESFLESAPQLVLQLYIMIKVTEDDHILTGIAAFFSLISLSWAIAAYTKALRTAAYSQDSRKRRVSFSGLALQTLWRVGMVAGRIVALVLCATVYQLWVIGGVCAHWLVMTVWLVVQDTDFCGTWWEEKLFNSVVGVIHIFCFFNMKEGRSRWRMVAFYAVTLIENTIMILLWFPHRTIGMWYNIPAMSVVWGGFLVGLAAMLLYYQYFHPSSPKRCHCCMLYYHLLYKCCPCREVTVFHGTPYRRGQNADEISSEFEYGNSNSFHGRPFEVDEIENFNPLAEDDESMISARPQFTSTPGDDLNGKYTKFEKRSLENLDKADGRADVSDSFSSPSDRLENVKDQVTGDLWTPSVLKNLPGGLTRPGADKGDSTLVRKWVENTRDIYGPDQVEATPDVGTLRPADKDEREFMRLHFGEFDGKPSGRRNILRMKSFGKKDREQQSLTKKNGVPVRHSYGLRSTFREAFGFHTVTGDGPVLDGRKIIVTSQPKRVKRGKRNVWNVVDVDTECATEARVSEQLFEPAMIRNASNKISARIDRPPEVTQLNEFRHRPKVYAEKRTRLLPLQSADRVLVERKDRKTKNAEKVFVDNDIILENIDPVGEVAVVDKPSQSDISDEECRDKVLAEFRDIPYVDVTQPIDTDSITVSKIDTKFESDIGSSAKQASQCLPKTCDFTNQLMVPMRDGDTGKEQSKENRVSRLCSEYFGPVVQVKGRTITVKHRDGPPLNVPACHELNLDLDTHQGDVQVTGQDPNSDFAQDDSDLVMLQEGNVVATRVFKPVMIRSNIVNTAACGSAIETDKRAEDKGRRCTKKGWRTPNSHARKKLSFVKASKTYSLRDANKTQTNGVETFRTLPDVGADENSTKGLRGSVETMLDGSGNYKVHLRDQDRNGPKRGWLPENGIDKKNSARRTLGAIENV